LTDCGLWPQFPFPVGGGRNRCQVGAQCQLQALYNAAQFEGVNQQGFSYLSLYALEAANKEKFAPGLGGTLAALDQEFTLFDASSAPRNQAGQGPNIPLSEFRNQEALTPDGGAGLSKDINGKALNPVEVRADLEDPTPSKLQQLFLGTLRGSAGDVRLKEMLENGVIENHVKQLGIENGDPQLWSKVKAKIINTITNESAASEQFQLEQLKKAPPRTKGGGGIASRQALIEQVLPDVGPQPPSPAPTSVRARGR